MRLDEKDKNRKEGLLELANVRSQLRKRHLALLCMLISLACTVSSAGTSKLYPPAKDEAGALRLSQVMKLATREEILGLGVSREHLLASGLKDSDFRDGSLAMGRVYCCHHVPPDMPVQVGDIVVVRMGREATKKDPGTVNAAIEVRETKDAADSKCSWDPQNERFWMRVLYCSWMPTEGWTLKGGLHKTWLKRASETKTQ